MRSPMTDERALQRRVETIALLLGVVRHIARTALTHTKCKQKRATALHHIRQVTGIRIEANALLTAKLVAALISHLQDGSKMENASAPAADGSTKRVKVSRKASMSDVTKDNTAKLSRDVAKAFFEADLTGEHKLSCEEFITVVPAAMKTRATPEDLQKLFESVDYDGNGFISIDEFFIWTLSFMRTTKGSGLDEVFLRYDKKGLGELNASDFARACEDIGFGDLANDFFIELDPENKGVIAPGSVLGQIKSRRVSREAKRFITELAFDADRKATEIDATHWSLDVDSKEKLRAHLQYLIREHDPPARVADLFHAMADDRQSLTKDEFAMALARMGLPPKNHWLTDAAFKQIDVSGCGEIRESELRAWINGVELRKARAKQLTLKDKPGRTRLRELEWLPATLREQLQLALISDDLTPLDFLRAYEASTRGSSGSEATQREKEVVFSKRDVLVMMKRILNDVELWDDVVRSVVEETFYALANASKVVEIEEFQKFLMGGWSEAKNMYEKGGGAAVQRKAPSPVMLRSQSAPVYGDPRWPNRVWPARRNDSKYAKRLLYRPSPVLNGQARAPPPLMPASRHTMNSNKIKHYVTTPDARALRHRLLLGKPLAHNLTYRYFQAHTPVTCNGSGWHQSSMPHAGVTMTGDLFILRSGGVLPKSGASRTSIATYVHPVRAVKPVGLDRTVWRISPEEQRVPRPQTA